MKDQWIGNNIELNLLCESIERFFRDNEFETRRDQAKGMCTIRASNPQVRITVNLYGQPNDFTIEFVPNTKTGGFSSSMILGYITSIFGGGALFLRDAKLQEALDSLEQTFWKYVDAQVAELTNSAATPR